MIGVGLWSIMNSSLLLWLRLLFEYLLENFFSRDSKLVLPRVSKLIIPDPDVVCDASFAELLDLTVLARTIFLEFGSFKSTILL